MTKKINQVTTPDNCNDNCCAPALFANAPSGWGGRCKYCGHAAVIHYGSPRPCGQSPAGQAQTAYRASLYA